MLATNMEIREIMEMSGEHFFLQVLKMLTSRVLFPYFVKAQKLSMLLFAILLMNLTGLPLVRKKSREIQGQGKVEILEFVREIWNFVKSQGNLRKFIS